MNSVSCECSDEQMHRHARVITVHIECVNVDGISANVINFAFVYMPWVPLFHVLAYNMTRVI